MQDNYMQYSVEEWAEIGKYVSHYGGSTAAWVLWRSWVGMWVYVQQSSNPIP